MTNQTVEQKLNAFMKLQQEQMAAFMATLTETETETATETAPTAPKNNATVHPQGKRYESLTYEQIAETLSGLDSKQQFVFLMDNVGVRSKNKFNLHDLYRTFDVGSPNHFGDISDFRNLLRIKDKKHVRANIAKQINKTTPDATPKERLVMAIVALNEQKAALKASPPKAKVKAKRQRKQRKQLTGRAVYLGSFTVNDKAPTQASLQDGKGQHIETVHAGNLQVLVPHLEVGEYLGLNGLKRSTINKCLSNIPTVSFNEGENGKMLRKQDANGNVVYYKIAMVDNKHYVWVNNSAHENDDGSYISAKFIARVK